MLLLRTAVILVAWVIACHDLAVAQTTNATAATTTTTQAPTNTSNGTTGAPTRPPTPAAPEEELQIEDVFVEDEDSSDSTRGMALAALIVSGIAGNYPNGILAVRSSLFLSTCIKPPPGPQSMLQLPVVASIGGYPEEFGYYFGASVLNPALFLALSATTGSFGLVIGMARGVSRREALASIHYPSHLAIPFGVMLVPSMYSAAVAVSVSDDVIAITMSTLFGLLFWPTVLAIMLLLLLRRFRAVYVRRMETIDESGNVTTVRRKIRDETDEVAENKAAQSDQAQSRSEFEMSLFSGFGNAGSRKSDNSSSQLADGLLDGRPRGRTGFEGATEYLRTAKAKRDDAVGQEEDRVEGRERPAGGTSWEVVELDRVEREEEVEDTRKVAEITDSVLRSMFSQAKRVGTDRLVLLYSVQGHFEWCDDDEVDVETVQNRADRDGRGYTEALDEAEETARAARGYVNRFGTFFVYYRRKYRAMFLAELLWTALLAFFTGLHASSDHNQNCYITTCCVAAMYVIDFILHAVIGPHISRLNNTYVNIITFVQAFAALLNVIAAFTKNVGAARAVNVYVVLLVYVCALRALLDSYVFMTQRLYASGVEWPALASLTDMHIKWQRRMRSELKTAEVATARTPLTTSTTPHPSGSATKNPPAKPLAGAAAAAGRDAPRQDADDDLDDDADHFGKEPRSTVEKWQMLRHMMEVQGVASRVVPRSMLPFEMVPLPQRVKLATKEKTERWERTRSELKQRVKWATTLQSFQHGGGGGGADGHADQSSSSDFSESGDDNEAGRAGGGDESDGASAFSHATRATTGTRATVGSAPSGAPNPAAPDMYAPPPGMQQPGFVVNDATFQHLMKKAEREEQEQKHRDAVSRHAAEMLHELEEGGFYTDEAGAPPRAAGQAPAHRSGSGGPDSGPRHRSSSSGGGSEERTGAAAEELDELLREGIAGGPPPTQEEFGDL